MSFRLDIIVGRYLVRLQSCRPIVWVERGTIAPLGEKRKYPLFFKTGF